MTVNGIELEFDFFDAEDVRKFETALAETQEAIAAAEKQDSLADVYEIVCRVVKEFYDTIFGEGTGEAVCGERDNFMTCIDAFEAAINTADEGRKALEEKTRAVKARFGGTRAQRRK